MLSTSSTMSKDQVASDKSRKILHCRAVKFEDGGASKDGLFCVFSSEQGNLVFVLEAEGSMYEKEMTKDQVVDLFSDRFVSLLAEKELHIHVEGGHLFITYDEGVSLAIKRCEKTPSMSFSIVEAIVHEQEKAMELETKLKSAKEERAVWKERANSLGDTFEEEKNKLFASYLKLHGARLPSDRKVGDSTKPVSVSARELPPAKRMKVEDQEEDFDAADDNKDLDIKDRVEAGWIHWNPDSESIERFLATIQPSRLSSAVCSWISVQNHNTDSPGYGPVPCLLSVSLIAACQVHLSKMAEIVETQSRVKASQKEECLEAILEESRRHNMKSGKWMLFPTSADDADRIWRMIALATAKGELGCSSKIGPAKDAGAHNNCVCCVYVKDFDDRGEVKRVLQSLRQLGLQISAGFKPDIFTHLGIKSNNQWRLPTVLYKVKDVDTWE